MSGFSHTSMCFQEEKLILRNVRELLDKLIVVYFYDTVKYSHNLKVPLWTECKGFASHEWCMFCDTEKLKLVDIEIALLKSMTLTPLLYRLTIWPVICPLPSPLYILLTDWQTLP